MLPLPSPPTATYATSESSVDGPLPAQKPISMSTPGKPHQYPRRTQWTSMPPDDSSSPRGRRTDSLDERTQINVTTAETKGIFRGNAPSPRKHDSYGKSHTQLRKPHLKKKQRKNRRETTALVSRPSQQSPEGEASCERRTRNALQNPDNPIRPRGKNNDQSKDPGSRWPGM